MTKEVRTTPTQSESERGAAPELVLRRSRDQECCATDSPPLCANGCRPGQQHAAVSNHVVIARVVTGGSGRDVDVGCTGSHGFILSADEGVLW